MASTSDLSVPQPSSESVGAGVSGLGVILAGTLGCGGRQSALVTASRDAERIADLFWWMTGVGTLIWLLVVVLAIYAIRAEKGHSDRAASFLIVGGGAVRDEVPVEGALILRGAGHYEGGCRPCHGGPEDRQPVIPEQMTPRPPLLPLDLDRWDPEELFYIVKHGVKFTAMPAWVTQERDDEVWAVVAFLLRFPDLDEAGYDRLVRGSEEADLELAVGHEPGGPDGDPAPRAVLETCARCHGIRGEGRGDGAFPRLAGQREEYLFDSLRAYAEGSRNSGIMAPVAAALEEGSMRELAVYYAGLSSGRSVDSEASPAIRRGEAIAMRGVPAQKVPACVDCHGPAAGPRSRHYPRLEGQHARYLELQLRLFHEDRRGGSRYAHLMQKVAPHLDEDQRRDVALYFASSAGALPAMAPDPSSEAGIE